MPMFDGKERHERGEMPGAFWEKDARNPEKAPVFVFGKTGGIWRKTSLVSGGKKAKRARNPGENPQE